MSTGLQSISSSSAQTRQVLSALAPSAAKGTAPASSAAPVSQVAKENFAKKAEVGSDLQKLHESIQASVERLNAMMKDSGRDLNIGIDKALGGPVVTVRNAESGEVVRQIPNEVVVKMAHSIEAFKGWLHDGNA
ncbi:flagellar protein FlaG [Limnohabitans sp. INBF002]|uniref:flagellar protein FlaG n=1 Tax=Limnohabitans sp. INBF002 TaxID=2986280 RepID=UPI0024901E26|nr:flagellar protein FlaG [Limnohabitans sp. INBF002]